MSISEDDQERRRVNFYLLLFLSLMLFAISALAYVIMISPVPFMPETQKYLAEKAPVIFGLPVAAIFSFFLVVLLKQSSGPIEFRAGGIEFKGASGQVVLWLLCFIGIAMMIKVLW